MTLLDDSAISEFLESGQGWDRHRESLVKTFTFKDFVEAMGFVTEVAILSEKVFHHPDIDIRWNRVTLTMSTHSEGGLTKKDTELAGQIDGLVAGQEG